MRLKYLFKFIFGYYMYMYMYQKAGSHDLVIYNNLFDTYKVQLLIVRNHADDLDNINSYIANMHSY